MLNLLLAWFALNGVGSLRAATPLVEQVCAELAKEGAPASDDERPYLCALPTSVREKTPEHYWWPADQYRGWLQAFPTTASAPNNLGRDPKQSHARANALVLDAKACRFFSSLSPSVQSGNVNTNDGRTFVVHDDAEFLAKCQLLAKAVAEKKQAPCTLVEFAGHSTQSVGLDNVFGIDLRNDELHLFPSPKALEAMGGCLRSISKKGAPIFLSTCGGDRVKTKLGDGKVHYWPGKKRAQRELRRLFQAPIISGVGLVTGTAEGGVSCDEGWFKTP